MAKKATASKNVTVKAKPVAKANANAKPNANARPVAKAKAKPKPTPVAKAKPVFTKPSVPLPPPPPPQPAGRDEMIAPRDVARLIRYGEKFGDKKIDVRWLVGAAVPVAGGLTIFDPAHPKQAKTFDRPSGAGQFRVMYAVAQQDGKPEKLAAIVVHVGRPPIAKWTVAHYANDKKPKTPDALPRIVSQSGWIAIADRASAVSATASAPPAATGVAPSLVGGALLAPSGTGEFAAYWAVDAADKPICLVVDFDVLTQKDWRSKPS